MRLHRWHALIGPLGEAHDGRTSRRARQVAAEGVVALASTLWRSYASSVVSPSSLMPLQRQGVVISLETAVPMRVTSR